jgi:hypothetical protein
VRNPTICKKNASISTLAVDEDNSIRTYFATGPDRSRDRARVHFSEDGQILFISGIFVDYIIAVTEPIPILEICSAADLEKTILGWKQLVLSTVKDKEYYVGKGTIDEASWKTIVMDTYLKSYHVVPTNQQNLNFQGGSKRIRLFDLGHPDLRLPTSSSNDLSDFCAALVRMRAGILSNRRMFITAQGSIGIGPYNSKIGDIVFVIFGAEVPCVLRLLDNHKNKGGMVVQ